MQKVKISTEFIKLEQMMKFSGIVGSGSDAKVLIGNGEVRVNGNTELQRGKKLRAGDVVEFEGQSFIIE